MKMEDISNGYSVRGPRCEPLEQNQNYYNTLDNLYDYDDNYDYEEYSGDSKESIYDNEYDDSNGFDEESRSPRDLDFMRNLGSNLLSGADEYDKPTSEMINFEKALNAIIVQTEESKSNLVFMKIGQLDTKFSFLNWTYLFQSAFNSIEEEKVVDESMEILIQEDFLKGINQLISEYQSNGSQNVLENYMVLKAVSSFYPNPPELIDDCIEKTEDIFSPVLTAMFVKSKGIEMSNENLKEGKQLFKIVKDDYKENIKTFKWMNEAHILRAEKKLDQMSVQIGYPNSILNDTWLDSMFLDLEIIPGQFVKNYANYRDFYRRMEMKSFLKPVLKNSWSEIETIRLPKLAKVSPTYTKATNTLTVPIGILQPPFFWSHPKSLAFGSLGYMIAHEITHAFDQDGMMFNSGGLFEILESKEGQNIFDDNSKCITQQYKKFIKEKVGNITNPTLTNKTIDEIISDQGGLQIAEIMFEKWLKNNDLNYQNLFGLEDFNDPFQLFYISQTLSWCSSEFNNIDSLKTQVEKAGHHPIHEFRVRGPLSNSLKFAKTWNCSVKSTMNPQEKCQIW